MAGCGRSAVGSMASTAFPAARAVCAPPAVEDAFAILPQELEITQPISVELNGSGSLAGFAAPASVRLLHALLCDFAVVRGTKQAWEPQEGRTADSHDKLKRSEAVRLTSERREHHWRDAMSGRAGKVN